jgi:hypothetical protein
MKIILLQKNRKLFYSLLKMNYQRKNIFFKRYLYKSYLLIEIKSYDYDIMIDK